MKKWVGGGGLHGGWNLTLGLWPHIGNAYCYSTLQAEAVCTATALSRPAATPQKGEKYAARRAVLHRTCLLAPKHKLYCFGGKTKIFRSTTCSPQRGAPTCLGSRHWLLGGVQGTLGKCSTPGCCTLPCVRPTKSGQQYWRYLIAPCEVLPGAPHLQPVHPFPLSEEKTYRMRSLSIINVLETRSRESNYFLTSAPKGNLSWKKHLNRTFNKGFTVCYCRIHKTSSEKNGWSCSLFFWGEPKKNTCTDLEGWPIAGNWVLELTRYFLQVSAEKTRFWYYIFPLITCVFALMR